MSPLPVHDRVLTCVCFLVCVHMHENVSAAALGVHVRILHIFVLSYGCVYVRVGSCPSAWWSPGALWPLTVNVWCDLVVQVKGQESLVSICAWRKGHQKGIRLESMIMLTCLPAVHFKRTQLFKMLPLVLSLQQFVFKLVWTVLSQSSMPSACGCCHCLCYSDFDKTNAVSFIYCQLAVHVSNVTGLEQC